MLSFAKIRIQPHLLPATDSALLQVEHKDPSALILMTPAGTLVSSTLRHWLGQEDAVGVRVRSVHEL